MKKIIKGIPLGYIIYFIFFIILVSIYLISRETFIKLAHVISIIGMSFIAYLVLRIYKVSDVKNIKYKKYIGLIFIVIAIVGAILYISYLKTEKDIKTWDGACYWTQNIKFSQRYENDSINMIKDTIASINNDEYNTFPSLLLTSLFSFTDKTFLWYVLSVYILFLSLTVALYNLFIMKMIKKMAIQDKYHLITCIFANLPFIMCPMLHYPIIVGYLDVLGLIFVLSIINILIDYNFDKIHIEKIVLAIITTVLLIISRRYFIFFILGFYISKVIVELISNLINKKYKNTLKMIAVFAIITAGVLIILMVKFLPMIERIIKSNVGNLYVGYKEGGTIYQILEIFKRYSYVIIGLSITGYITSIVNKNTRKVALILILTFIITTFLFSTIQSMGSHHMYLIIIPVVAGISLLILQVGSIKKQIISYILQGLIVVIILLNLIVAITTDKLYPVLSNKILFPKVRSDYNNIVEIRKDIDNQVGKDAKIYVIAASDNYNSETFQNIFYPDLDSGNLFVTPSNVDLTHGFRTSFYESNYIMTVSPIQYHLDPEHQQCVTILYEAIENESPLNDNYELVQQWNDIEYVIIKLYKNIASLTEKDKIYLAEKFNIYYSEYKELFYDRIMSQ